MNKHFISLIDFYNLTLQFNTCAKDLEHILNKLNIFINHVDMKNNLTKH